MRLFIALSIAVLLTVSAFAQTNNRPKLLAENFTATALDGKTFDLSDFRGKIVVLTFWSTRCAICHNEIPKLNRLTQTYKDKNIVFLGLTMEAPNKIEPYLKKTNFNFTILPNSFGVVLKYADKSGDGRIAMGFPAHFLINQKGEIELKTSGFDKTEMLESGISQLLNAK